MSRERRVGMKLTGSPSVAATAIVQREMEGLMNAVLGRPIDWVTEAWCICDGCGAQSEPLDLAHPEAAEEALLTAGWVRDAEVGKDLCPACTGGAR